MIANDLSIAIIIPARLGSSRFPNKPLASIFNRPMIEVVYSNACQVPHVDVVAVATCDIEIKDLVEDLGGVAVMTSPDHQRATDRTAEALLKLESERGAPFDLVIMLQGDEPCISPRQLSSVIEVMVVNPEVKVTNLLGKISSQREFLDPNCIKVVSDLVGNALYFSRMPIPHGAHFNHPTVGKQVCAIGFRRDYLLTYLALQPTDLEEQESIDMLRILQHGESVRLVVTDQPTQSVDIPEDISVAESLLQRDKLGVDDPLFNEP